jgi:hypothetical protein
MHVLTNLPNVGVVISVVSTSKVKIIDNVNASVLAWEIFSTVNITTVTVNARCGQY